MKVAVVVRTLQIGGMERVAISLAEAFASSGHEAHLIYFKTKQETLKPKENVKLHHFKLDFLMHLTIIGFIWEFFSRVLNSIFRKSYFLWKGLFTSKIFEYKLSNLEKQYGKFDLIIVRGQGTLEVIHNFKDDRLVFVSESIFSYGTLNKFIRKLQIQALFQNRNLVTVSEGVLDGFKEAIIKENLTIKKLVTITNPIEIEYTKFLAHQYTPNIDSPYILSVGRIIPSKNIPLLIEAYSYAKQQFHIKHKLVIVGDGSEISLVKEKIKALNLQDDILLEGQLINPFPWMRGADLFILSSKIEGLGMVLLEALACETKVIATKSQGGVTDIMNGELAHYLAEQTPQALGEKIFEALNDNKELDFDKYLAKFKPEYIVNEYLKHFCNSN